MSDYYPPTDLDGFLAAYASDDNDWWRLQAGDQMNLFDDAIEQLRQAEAKIEHLRALLRPDEHNVGWMGRIIEAHVVLTQSPEHVRYCLCGQWDPQTMDHPWHVATMILEAQEKEADDADV